MRRLSSRIWIVPLLLVGAALVALPILATTDSWPERRLRDALGVGSQSCDPSDPTIVKSPGWRVEPSLPWKRDEGRAEVLDGIVHLAGGLERPEGQDQPTSVASFTGFDPDTGRYAGLPAMPERLDHLGMVRHRGDVYIVGGHSNLESGALPRRDFLRYSPASRRWTRMPDLPTARGAAGVGVIGGRLFVAGGQAGGRVLATVESYDFETGRWTREEDMPSAREHVAATVADGKLYVLGGRNRATDALDTVERYDLMRKRWERLAPLPVPTGGAEAVTVDGRVVVMGGGNDRAGTVTGAVQSFDPRTGVWSELSPMRTKRHGFSAALVNGRVYTLGGSTCPYYAATDTVESFDPTRPPR